MKIPSERNLTSADRIWSTFRLLLDFKLSKDPSNSSFCRVCSFSTVSQTFINSLTSLENVGIEKAKLRPDSSKKNCWIH